jgi:hypothetical protein
VRRWQAHSGKTAQRWRWLRGKPPVKHQFKKGTSGNPSGRRKLRLPKLPLDFQKNLIAELKSPMTIVEAGKKKKLSKLEALMKSLIAQALKGDKTAIKILVHFLEKLPAWAFSDDEVVGVVTKKNLEAMDRFLQKADEYAHLLEIDSNPKNKNAAQSS